MRSKWIKAVLLGLGLAGSAAAQTPMEENLKAGEAFLAKTAQSPGTVVLPSGVMYRTVSRTPGDDTKPLVSDIITIHYHGTLIDGTVFDSSVDRGQPATFPLSRLIPAWKEVIPLMRVGDEVLLFTPPSQAYGPRASGKIPANSTLIFRVQLIAVQK